MPRNKDLINRIIFMNPGELQATIDQWRIDRDNYVPPVKKSSKRIKISEQKSVKSLISKLSPEERAVLIKELEG